MASPRSIQTAILALLGATMIVIAIGLAAVLPEPRPDADPHAPRAPASFGYYSLQ